MATKKRAREIKRPSADRNVLDTALRDFGRENMTTYAVAVNLDRSVPDLYDGMKPVQRRILWGMANSGGKTLQKSAQTVGFVLGKLHPHGDLAVYGAMVTMANQPTPTIYGSGNWGSMVDGPAAYRYTNAKLTQYGLSFVEPDYIVNGVTSFVPNFDDKWVEPVTLPAQLPNVLLNGGDGIGVGITTKLPSFTPDSVIDVLVRMFKGEKLEIKDFARTLKFNLKYGGQIVDTKENRLAYRQMFRTSTAKVQFESPLEVQRDQKRIIISEWPPGLGLESFVKKVRSMPETQSVANTSGVTTYTIECKPGYNYDQFDKFVEKVRKATQTRISYRLNVTRRIAKIDDGRVSFETKFEAYSVPRLLVQWCRERVKLELRSLAHRISKVEEAIDYDLTMLKAVDNIDLIIKVIRSSEDPEAALVRKMKIKPHQAKWICDLQLRKISKLDQSKYKTDLKNDRALLAQLKSWEANPKAKIAEDLERMRALLKKDRQFEHTEETQELTVV